MNLRGSKTTVLKGLSRFLSKENVSRLVEAFKMPSKNQCIGFSTSSATEHRKQYFEKRTSSFRYFKSSFLNLESGESCAVEAVRCRRRQGMVSSCVINNVTPGFWPKVTKKLKISSLAATAPCNMICSLIDLANALCRPPVGSCSGKQSLWVLSFLVETHRDEKQTMKYGRRISKQGSPFLL